MVTKHIPAASAYIAPEDNDRGSYNKVLLKSQKSFFFYLKAKQKIQ